MLSTTIRYILITAMGDRFFLGLLLGLGAAVLIAGAMGNTAMVEPEQMTLSLAAAAARMIVAVGLIVFVCFHVRRAFETKEMDVLLSRPIARSTIVWSFWIGFSCVACLLVAAVAGMLWLTGVLNLSGFTVWCASLLLESLLVVAMALFAALTLNSAVGAVLASLALYVVSRMMGFFVATTKAPMVFDTAIIDVVMKTAIEWTSIMIPRLDFFAKSSWLVYGVTEEQAVWLFIGQAAVFIPLLLVASIIDFKRKTF